jgi:hypothetical protein
MEINEIIARLGRDLEIENLELTNSMCRLVFDETLEVFVEHLPEQGLVFIHGTVGQAPGKDRGDVYRTLLAGAAFGVETGGAAFGVDEEKDELLLFFRLEEQGLEYDAFYDRLEVFVERLEAWRKVLKALAAGVQSGESPVNQTPTIIRG